MTSLSASGSRITGCIGRRLSKTLEELFYRNRLCKVARLVHVAALGNGDVVGQQLERDNGKDGLEAFLRIRNLEIPVGQGLDIRVPFGDYADDPALASLDFLDIAQDFFVVSATGCNHDDRHFLVDQGDRAMFHLRGGIAFCVDVGDFLQFKRTLQRNGIIVAASQIEEVVRIGENLRKVGYLRVVFQNLGNLFGDILQFPDKGGLAFA